MELYPSPENRLPTGATCHELVTADGVRLRAMVVVPDKAKGTVVFLNGRADYMERYFETLQDLTKKGFAVATMDWRGQGGSQRLMKNPHRGYVNSFAAYDADLEALMTQLVVKQCPKPYYGLAHSTGAHVMLRALRGKSWFKKAVLSAPLLGFYFGAWPIGVVRILTGLAKITGLSWVYLPGFNQNPLLRRDFNGNPLTSSKPRWIRDLNTLNANPSLSVGGPTYSWLRAAMVSLDELRRWPRAKGPSCPTMIVMAGKDRVVNNANTRDFVARAPGFTLTTIADSQHEILIEDNDIRQRFFAAFEAFIDA
jgi:lysophospholipase